MRFLATILLALLCWTASAQQKSLNLTFCCSPDNDVFKALRAYDCPRFNTPSQAIANAPEKTGVLIMADSYPERATAVEPAEFEKAQRKHLKLFVEFPASLPGMEVSLPQTATWERVVVKATNFDERLPAMRILGINDCHFVAVLHPPTADLTLARVAGYDTAVYGLPARAAYPILFSVPEKNLTVATTKLSSFISGRFEPVNDWRLVWLKILSQLDPDNVARLHYTPVVTPTFGNNEQLPPTFQRDAFNRAANWFSHSHLLVSPLKQGEWALALKVGVETTTPPAVDEPEGDGSLGMIEGYSSGIQWDGQQPRRLPIRADCNAETAMVLALDGALGNKQSTKIANNLLDYVYFNSDICQGVRGDPKHPAFGLIGWGSTAPAWLVANYGDDNARAMLGTMLVGSLMHSDRWDKPLVRGLLANLRTTGKLGFRDDRVDVPALEQNGWEHFYNASNVNYSPHFDSYLWACNLWAYRETHYAPFLERTTNAIAMTMKAYPEQWRWQDNLERARMLLCLAWLVQLDKTAHISTADDAKVHRQWLEKVAHDLLADQLPSGTIRERRGLHGAPAQEPQSNEEYGTGETPLIHQNGDPVSDQLYTTGFALLGLHEAVGATHDATLEKAEDKLAEFLCRIQTKSKKIGYCDGIWFRAFDDHRWDFWASSADIGWGAWSIEGGWGQAWAATTLGLREKRTTFWDLTQRTQIAKQMDEVLRQMGLPE